MFSYSLFKAVRNISDYKSIINAEIPTGV